MNANFGDENPINEFSNFLENLLLIQSYSKTIRRTWECQQEKLCFNEMKHPNTKLPRLCYSTLNGKMLNIIKGLSKVKALGHNTLLQELCSKLASVRLVHLL